jgi:hypothetical protein
MTEADWPRRAERADGRHVFIEQTLRKIDMDMCRESHPRFGPEQRAARGGSSVVSLEVWASDPAVRSNLAAPLGA